MTRRFLIASAAVAGSLALAGCATATAPNPTAPTAAPATAAPTVAPTAAPTAAPVTTAPSYGVGDTTANPDSTFEAAASTSVGGSIVAYATIAGTDSAAAASLLSTLTANGAWASVDTVPAQGYYAVPGCHLTDGSTTVRIYTALAGDPATTASLCASLSGS